MSTKMCSGIALTIAVAALSALVPDTANAQMYVAGPGYYNGLRFQTNVTPSGYYGSYYYNGVGNVGVFNGSPAGQGFNGIFSGGHRRVYSAPQPAVIYPQPAAVPTKEPPVTNPSR